jgi:hypothetical protein
MFLSIDWWKGNKKNIMVTKHHRGNKILTFNGGIGYNCIKLKTTNLKNKNIEDIISIANNTFMPENRKHN